MSIHRTMTRASAVIAAAAVLAPVAAAAQPADGSRDQAPWLRALNIRSEALNAQSGLGASVERFHDARTGRTIVIRTDTGADPFAACLTVGTPTSLERFICYRSAVNLATGRQVISTTPSTLRPVVVEGPGFDWVDSGVGFAVAAGVALVGLGAAMTVRSRRTSPARGDVHPPDRAG